MKKLRGDSRIGKLAERDREQLDAALLAGEWTLEEAREWLAARGVKISQQNISNYYRRHVLPTKWQRMGSIAAELNRVQADGVTEAARRAVAQMVFGLATDPSADPKLLATFYKLMLDSQSKALDERRLELMEARARQADEAKAALERKVANGGLTAEALALAEEALNLL